LPKTLIARQIEALQPPPRGRIEVRDVVARGLCFRITATGSRTWSLYAKLGGRDGRFHIGDYPAVSLAEARELATKMRVEFRAEVRAGRNPIAERRRALADQAAASALTVAKVLDSYDQLHLAQLKDGKARGRSLRAALEGHARRPVSELTRADLQAVIDAKAASGAKVAANRLKAALSHFANWARKRSYISEAIGADLDKATKERPRERVLSLDELGAIWKATFLLTDPAYGAFVRVLALTAQRVSDVADMAWPEIEGDRWSIPGARVKNDRPHIVHLTAPTRAEIEALRGKPQPPEAPPLVFLSSPSRSDRGGRRLSSFGRLKIDLDRLCGVTDWRLHDLRTAFATHVCEAGIAENIADRVLNHAASASRASVVARTYQRSELLPQRAVALECWTNILLRAAGEREPVVVELRRGAPTDGAR
jgi:integrase